MKQFTTYQLWMWYNGTEKFKWNYIYDTEQELLDDLKRANFSTTYPRGLGFLLPFQNMVKLDIELTEKQMTQLKRNAVSVAFTLYK